MKIYIMSFALILICAAVIVAARETTYLTNIGTFPSTVSMFLPYSLHEDLLVVSTLPQNTFQIRKRDADGLYPVQSTINLAGTYPITNGRWIGAIAGNSLTVGKLSATYQISNPVTFGYSVKAAKLFDDDTLVILDGTLLAFVTLKFNTSTNAWNELQRTNVASQFYPFSFGMISSSSDPTLCFQGNYFVGYNISISGNTGAVLITVLERQADLSWATIIEISAYDILSQMYFTGLAIYNGVDTIVVTNPVQMSSGSQGEISILMKNHVTGNWSVIQTITPSSIGYRPAAGLAMAQFLNATTLMITAPLENVQTNGNTLPSNGGRASILSWNTTQWVPTNDFATNDNTFFGTGLANNKKDILIYGMNINRQEGSLFAYPYCSNDPINVTCLTQHLDDCSDLDYNSWYIVHPQCGRVTVQFTGLGLTDNSVTARYTFTKTGQSLMCNATIYCPTSPTTCPPVTQSIPNAPHVPATITTPITLPSAAPTEISAPLEGPVSTSVPSMVPIFEEPLAAPNEISPISGPVTTSVPVPKAPNATVPTGLQSPDSVSDASVMSVSAAVFVITLVL